jgi:hypothetical protein
MAASRRLCLVGRQCDLTPINSSRAVAPILGKTWRAWTLGGPPSSARSVRACSAQGGAMTIRSTKRERNADARRPLTRRPHSIPTLIPESDVDISDLEPEVRYRMLSEAAYHRYVDRGCEEGYDVDDWAAAEAELDHQLCGAVKAADSTEGE